MADIVFQENNETDRYYPLNQIYEDNDRICLDKITLFGKKGTYKKMEFSNGFIICLGYFNPQKETYDEVLQKIFNNISKEVIIKTKKEIPGQYIFIIKKDDSIYLFNDFWGIRKIFYSINKNIISTYVTFIENCDNSFKDITLQKNFEYISMNTILYPSLLNGSFFNKNIRYLRNYEYIEYSDNNINIKKIILEIDNKKRDSIINIKNDINQYLFEIIADNNFINGNIGLTITGGYDSRLISTIGNKIYKKSELMISISSKNLHSKDDMKIAKKISKCLKTSLRVYNCEMNENDYKKFQLITEGMSPKKNSVILPMILNSNKYDLGYGGAFGTEHFISLYEFRSISDFIKKSIEKAKGKIEAGNIYWDALEKALKKEFSEIRKYYKLKIDNHIDYLRIFTLQTTSFFGSYMLSSFNINGLKFDPYGTAKFTELMMQLNDNYWKSQIRENRYNIEKILMVDNSRKVGKIITSHHGPMVPYENNKLLYIWQKIRYFIPYAFKYHIRKIIAHDKIIIREMHDFKYQTNGWDEIFIKRFLYN